jgi:hypothetical protein
MENNSDEYWLSHIKLLYQMKVNSYEIDKNYKIVNEKTINISASSVQRLKVIGLIKEKSRSVIKLIEQVEIELPPIFNCILYTQYDINNLTDEVYYLSYSDNTDLIKDDKIVEMVIKQIR